MKTIYATGVYGEPYRIVVSDEKLREVKAAQSWLRYSPWRGELWINLSLLCLSSGAYVPGYISVTEAKTTILAQGPEGQECILGHYDEDVLELPNVHVTHYFDITIGSLVFYLTEGDIRLIEGWGALQNRKYREMVPNKCDYLVTLCL